MQIRKLKVKNRGKHFHNFFASGGKNKFLWQNIHLWCIGATHTLTCNLTWVCVLMTWMIEEIFNFYVSCNKKNYVSCFSLVDFPHAFASSLWPTSRQISSVSLVLVSAWDSYQWSSHWLKLTWLIQFNTTITSLWKQ